MEDLSICTDHNEGFFIGITAVFMLTTQDQINQPFFVINIFSQLSVLLSDLHPFSLYELHVLYFFYYFY
ncbi:hypothetical protein LAD12857_22540 [Lacrimispora amygdalina]|uniref:Uncharacterized protein n=1 Tax=Lacrimispora amygdalina TaxID=253257 RepID=A0ABQ5M6Z3_9FIRM